MTHPALKMQFLRTEPNDAGPVSVFDTSRGLLYFIRRGLELWLADPRKFEASTEDANELRRGLAALREPVT